MVRRHWSSIYIVSVALAGCTATTLAPLAPTHPASPEAAEAPLPPPSATLAETPTTPGRPPSPPGRGTSHRQRTPAAVYTCPMHPEVRRSQPGQCPKCGMNLVPEDESGGGEHAH